MMWNHYYVIFDLAYHALRYYQFVMFQMPLSFLLFTSVKVWDSATVMIILWWSNHCRRITMWSMCLRNTHLGHDDSHHKFFLRPVWDCGTTHESYGRFLIGSRESSHWSNKALMSPRKYAQSMKAYRDLDTWCLNARISHLHNVYQECVIIMKHNIRSAEETLKRFLITIVLHWVSWLIISSK